MKTFLFVCFALLMLGTELGTAYLLLEHTEVIPQLVIRHPTPSAPTSDGAASGSLIGNSAEPSKKYVIVDVILDGVTCDHTESTETSTYHKCVVAIAQNPTASTTGASNKPQPTDEPLDEPLDEPEDEPVTEIVDTTPAIPIRSNTGVSNNPATAPVNPAPTMPAPTAQPNLQLSQPTPVPPTPIPAPTYVAQLQEQKQFIETNFPRLWLYVESSTGEPVGGYTVLIEKDGNPIAINGRRTEPTSYQTWSDIEPERNKLGNLKLEFPEIPTPGQWKVQLIDVWGNLASPPVFFHFSEGESRQEMYLRYRVK